MENSEQKPKTIGDIARSSAAGAKTAPRPAGPKGGGDTEPDVAMFRQSRETGCLLRFQLHSGAVYFGKVAAFGNFSVRIKCPDQGPEMVIFKNFIACMEVA